jgi:hypothetical protein
MPTVDAQGALFAEPRVFVDHEKVLKDAFGEVRNKVAADTALPVFAGSPES